jgi:hypothetical protein
MVAQRTCSTSLARRGKPSLLRSRARETRHRATSKENPDDLSQALEGAIIRFRDYVAEPKDDGYRALHLINRNRGRLIEVQIRTPRQDLWANAVETFARTVAPGLKFGGGPVELREYFLALGDLFEVRDQGLDLESALLDRIEEWQRRADTLLKEHVQ